MADSRFAQSVLVIDDDPAFSRLAESAVTPSGIPVMAVRSGEDGLKLLQNEKPLAVIVDGLLPGIRGDEVAYRIRQRWPQGELPIVFVSAFFRDIKSRQRLLNVIKCDAVLHKPVTVEDLKRSLARFKGFDEPKDLAPEEELELDITTSVELLTDFLVLSVERIVNMRRGISQFGTEHEAQGLKDFRTEAHRFRGTGASFGLPEVSRLGGQMEELLERHKFVPKLPSEVTASLSGMLDALEVKLVRAGATLPAFGGRGSSRTLKLLVIDGPGDLALSCSEAAGRGQPVRLYAEPGEALASLAEEPADAVFVAADRRSFDAFEVCAQISKISTVPVVLLAEDSTFAARLKAQAKGARGYVHRVPDVRSLFKMAIDFATPPRGLSVLALAADRQLLLGVAESLVPEGLSVIPCLEPRELFERLDQEDPAVLVLASELPGVNGLSLLKAVRADARHGAVPVVVLARSGERQERLEALDAGADDVVATPLDPAELVARMRVQVRHRASQLRSSSDALPGFPSVDVLREEVARAIVLARRGRTLAVLAFEADLDEMTRSRGRLRADAAVAALGAKLKAGLRSSDVVAHLGDARFGVLLHDAPKASAQKLLKEHLKRLNEHEPFGEELQLSVRGSMASFPEVRGDADVLIDTALADLTASRH